MAFELQEETWNAYQDIMNDVVQKMAPHFVEKYNLTQEMADSKLNSLKEVRKERIPLVFTVCCRESETHSATQEHGQPCIRTGVCEGRSVHCVRHS